MSKTEVWLTKEQVMKVLDRSERTVENLVNKGLLERKTVRDGRYNIPVYSAASVEAYKSGQTNGHLVPVSPAAGAIAAAASAAPATASDEIDPLQLHPWQFMTRTEAARFKRMPFSWIDEQIANGRLPYEDTVKGIRILRSDLEQLGSSMRNKGRR